MRNMNYIQTIITYIKSYIIYGLVELYISYLIDTIIIVNTCLLYMKINTRITIFENLNNISANNCAQVANILLYLLIYKIS